MSIRSAIESFEFARDAAEQRNDPVMVALIDGLIEMAKEVRIVESKLTNVEAKISRSR